jgi:hypothetical protein
MNTLVKFFNIILLINISCSTNDNSLTKEDIENIKGINSLLTSIIERKPDDEKVFNTYFITELNLKLDLPNSAYIIKRDGGYHKGQLMEFPSFFREIQKEMYEADKYLICFNDFFILNIVNLSGKYNQLVDTMSDTEYINTCLNDYLKSEAKYVGVKKINGNNYIVFSDDMENDYYYLSVKNFAILIDITKKANSEDVVGFMLESIEVF